MDELSNWYVRRNRRRFWKGELDDDKRAAYATLHRVLVDLTRLLAPFVPHLAEAMWQNLVAAVQPEAPDSVHLADFPETREGVRDEALEASVALARQVVALGRTARAASGVRTRQPLATARVKLPGGAGTALSADPARGGGPDRGGAGRAEREGARRADRCVGHGRADAVSTAARDRPAARQGSRARSWLERGRGNGGCWTTVAWRLAA